MRVRGRATEGEGEREGGTKDEQVVRGVVGVDETVQLLAPWRRH